MPTVAKNIIEKIWQKHVVLQKEGHPAILGIDLQLLHEVTSAQAFQRLRQLKLPVKEPHHCLATLDHSIPTRKNRDQIFDLQARAQVNTLRENVKEFGVPFQDFDSGKQGIVHVIGPELGLTQPGMTIVCGDSHTSTHGAFGALAFGIGTTEVFLVLATGCLLLSPPKTMEVRFSGQFQSGVSSKDAILKLISQIGVGGANEHVIEYTGEAVRKMSMEARMTLCNMSIECGGRAGLIGPDETTFDYLEGRPFAPQGKECDRALKLWESYASDTDATYDRQIKVDVSHLKPMVTWGTNPAQGIEIDQKIPEDADPEVLTYMDLQAGRAIEGTPIQWAFLGSCTNARIEDLRVAAELIKGRKVHSGVTMYVVPGSEAVKSQAEAEGLDQIFIEAGADWRMPGCSMCLGMNDDKVPAGERCISSSNRNFVGRQGPGSRTHLASPATVAASAIQGFISSSL